MDISMITDPSMIDIIDFGPDIINLISIEIRTRQIPYKQIASKMHTAAGTIASWFSRGNIPADKVWLMMQAVGGARLWMQALAKIPGNVFYCRYLDGTDQNPKPIIEDTEEIAEQLLQLSRQAQKIIRHRQQGYKFAEDEDQTLRQFEDGIADMIIFGQMAMVRMEEFYGRSARHIMERQAERMAERGYLSEGKKETACSGMQTASKITKLT